MNVAVRSSSFPLMMTVTLLVEVRSGMLATTSAYERHDRKGMGSVPDEERHLGLVGSPLES